MTVGQPAGGSVGTWIVDRPSGAIERQMFWGERLMVCRLTIAPFTVTPVHSHVHEQMTVVERGRARFVIDGSERSVGPGDVLHFPSGCEHGATMLDEEVVLIDIFSPVREDVLAAARDGATVKSSVKGTGMWISGETTTRGRSGHEGGEQS